MMSNVAIYELTPETMFNVQGTEPKNPTGFSGAGELMVLVYAMTAVRHIIVNTQIQIQARQQADTFMINSWLFVAFCSLKNLLDGVASFCHRHHPCGSDDLVYFASHKFIQSDVTFIQKAQTIICGLRWNGKGFHQAANFAKHEFPFVGMGAEDKKGEGIYDIRDQNGVGFMYDLVAPCFNQMIQVLARLGQLHRVGNLPSLQRV